ncbi:MAG TPA: hypothetical protein PKA00_08260 [Saprospiraceae bacterium]|nr:hypothetical protein [Saprospiraceae bacterium]HMQ82887.1 hypothetical protein [Saprospiraceae bacterium]
MKQNFTSNHLIQFLYKETTVSERLAIEEALHDDILLRQQYRALKEAFQQLPKVTFRPATGVIQDILKYSERTALERHA